MKVLVAQLCATLCSPMDCNPPGSSVRPWDSPGKNIGVSSHSLFPGNLPDPGIKPKSPVMQVDSSPSEPPGKPLHCMNFRFNYLFPGKNLLDFFAGNVSEV